MKEKKLFEKDLVIIRNKIDKIDDRIVNLLNKRGILAQKIGNLKKKENIDIQQPQREKEIIKRMKKKSKILNHMNIEKIWKDIIDACKYMQGLKV